MSVRKRTLPSGKICWQLNYRDSQGVRRAKQFKKKEQAEAYETTVRVEIRDGIHVADRASITIAEAGEVWLERCRSENLEASTLAYYEQHLRLHIAPVIGGVKLSKLTRPMVQAFKDQLLATISPATSKRNSKPLVAKVMQSLRSLIFEAQGRGLVGQNVAVGTTVKVGDRHRRKIEIPTKSELLALLTATGEVWGPLSPWRPFVITALFTGLRASELRGLTWDHVDLDQKVIRVRQRADFKCKMGSPKSEAGNRDVPLAPMVLNVLREWRLACPKLKSNLVFPASRGGVIGHAEMWRAWDKLLKAAGLPPKPDDDAEPQQGTYPKRKKVKLRYRLHDLRHAAASLLIEQGWQPKKIQEVMGHSNISMTFDTYGHLWKTPEDDAAAMAQIEARLMGGLTLPTLRTIK